MPLPLLTRPNFGSAFSNTSPPAVLSALLNRLLAQNEQARALLMVHAGRTFEIEAGPVQAKLTIGHDGSLSPSDESVLAQVHLRLDIQALWALGWRPGQPLPKRDGILFVSGDVAMAQTLSTLAEHWRPDLEDLLAQKIGDIAARQFMRGAQSLLTTVWQSSQRLSENLVEYATHETDLLASAASVKAWSTQQQQLTERLTSLDERIAQLDQRLNQVSGRKP